MIDFLAPPRAGFFFVSSDADFEWCDSVTDDIFFSAFTKV
jgi:hypothetical protein